MSSEKNSFNTPRIPMADTESMSDEQKRVYDKIVSGKRGMIVGPLRALLHSPELADRAQLLGEFCRYDTDLPASISELAIICIGRYWNCQVEWMLHSGIAAGAGLDATIIEAIRHAKVPAFEDPLQIAVYEFTRELLEYGQVSDKVYQATLALLDEKSLVELTGLIGYYTLMAMTLNAHHVPLPESENGSMLDLPEDASMMKPSLLPSALAKP